MPRTSAGTGWTAYVRTPKERVRHIRPPADCAADDLAMNGAAITVGCWWSGDFHRLFVDACLAWEDACVEAQHDDERGLMERAM